MRQDLRLRDEERELIFKGPLKKRGGTQSESAELQVFLFDHAILMVKQKSKNEQYKVYRKVRGPLCLCPRLKSLTLLPLLCNRTQPIPLELLVVAPVDDAATARGGVVRPRSLMARGSSNKSIPASASQPPPGADKNKQGFAITFIHLGRRGYQITLWASTWTTRKKWLENIEERQNELRERSLVFETLPLSAGYFVGTNRLTCAAPFGACSSSLPSLPVVCVSRRAAWLTALSFGTRADHGNRMVYGTDNGVYLSDLRDKTKVPVKVISVPSVTQVDVLEEQGILIVLAGASPFRPLSRDRNVLTCPPCAPQTRPCRPSSWTTSTRATPSARPSAHARFRPMRPSSRRGSASAGRSCASSRAAACRARSRRSSPSTSLGARSSPRSASFSRAATRACASSRCALRTVLSSVTSSCS